MERRWLALEPGDVPDLDALVVQDLRCPSARVSWWKIRGQRCRLQEQRDDARQGPTHSETPFYERIIAARVLFRDRDHRTEVRRAP